MAVSRSGGLTLPPAERDPVRIVAAIRQLVQGRNDATGVVTLRPGATTTFVDAFNCGVGSAVFLFPQTATAAAAVPSTFVNPDSVGKRGFTITYANTAIADRTYWFVCLG
jgi:hypothetical protein